MSALLLRSEDGSAEVMARRPAAAKSLVNIIGLYELKVVDEDSNDRTN